MYTSLNTPYSEQSYTGSRFPYATIRNSHHTLQAYIDKRILLHNNYLLRSISKNKVDQNLVQIEHVYIQH